MATESETQPLLGSHATITSRKCAQATILATVTLERITFYALVGNFYLFLNQRPLQWVSYDAMTAFYIFTGIVYFMALLTGCLGDSVGKFRTLVAALVLYLFGYAALVFLTSETYLDVIPSFCEWRRNLNHTVGDSFVTRTDDEPEPCKMVIYIILVVIAIAASTVIANISPFGADQVTLAGEETTRRFFNWYYWCINIGVLISLGCFAYIQQSTKWGFFLGYLLPCICIGIALLVFVLGRRCYIIREPVGSAVFDILRIVIEACKARRRRKIWIERLANSRSDGSTPQQPSWLDMAKVGYGGSFHNSAVDDVKKLGKVLIVFIALIPYWTVYFQMQTGFTAQGLHMKLNPYASAQSNCSGDNCTYRFMIPSAWLTLFDVIFLILLIPVMEKLVYPFLDRHHIHMSMLTKISIGMVIAFLAILVAGCLETYRLDLVDDGQAIVQVIGNTTYNAADLWIMWQAPQYTLIGISEAFASVSSLEFAYSQSPNSIKSMIMGLTCMLTGVGSFLGTVIMQSVRPLWFPDTDIGNINYGHLNYYFFLLAGIQLLSILIFLPVASRYNIGDSRTPMDLSQDQPSTQDPRRSD